jgi:hypothetical protein
MTWLDALELAVMFLSLAIAAFCLIVLGKT